MLNLFRITVDELNWLRSLGRKLRRLTTWQVIVGILLTMASQLFVFMAFMLPLKVILLVASKGVPWYIAPFATAETKDRFVIILGTTAIASYGIYHLCNWAVKQTVASGARRVLAKAQKLHLFNNQEEVAEQGYQRFVSCVGSGVIAVLGFGAGVAFNPAVFGPLIGVIVLEYLLVAGLLRLDSGVSRKLAAAFEGNLSTSVGVLSSLNFLIAFALLLVQFLQAEQLSVIIAILSILLVRQVLQRCTTCVQNLAYLSKNRLRLTTLFYTSVQYLPPSDKHHDAFLESLRPRTRNRWLTTGLAEVLGTGVAGLESRWIDSGSPGVAHLAVTAAEGRWFVKYYSHRHSLRAAHEAQLFTSHPDDLPGAPRFLGEGFVGGNRLLVFEVSAMQPLEPERWKLMAVERLLAVWSLAPDPELVSAYRRTHSTLVERLDAGDVGHVEVAAETEAEQAVLATFRAQWPAIRDTVASLPLVIRNPALTGLPNWVGDAEDAPYCLSWNNWSIEPVGCEPLLLKVNEEKLAEVLEEWHAADAFERSITAADLRLVARLAVLEQALRKKNLRHALDTLVALVEEWQAPAALAEPEGAAHANA